MNQPFSTVLPVMFKKLRQFPKIPKLRSWNHQVQSLKQLLNSVYIQHWTQDLGFPMTIKEFGRYHSPSMSLHHVVSPEIRIASLHAPESRGTTCCGRGSHSMLSPRTCDPCDDGSYRRSRQIHLNRVRLLLRPESLTRRRVMDRSIGTPKREVLAAPGPAARRRSVKWRQAVNRTSAQFFSQLLRTFVGGGIEFHSRRSCWLDRSLPHFTKTCFNEK